MSVPTLKTLGVSAEKFATGGDRKANAASHSRLMLHGRVNLFNQDGSFDKIRISLQGAIRTKIGSTTAVEKTLLTSTIKTHLDFKPVYSATQKPTEEQYLDFDCPVPSPRNARSGSFVPTMKMEGTTYLTKVTALTNRELLQGICEVTYTLQADFLDSKTDQIVRKITCPVEISSCNALDADLVSAPASGVEQIAKPQLRSMSRFFGPSVQPRVSIELPKNLGSVVSDATTGCRRLTVPVSVNVFLPATARRQAQPLSDKDQLRCLVKAQWYTKRTFNTGRSSVESTVHSDRVSTQSYAITLPPLYRFDSESSKYTSMAELDLLLPASMSTPSMTTDLLQIGYTLDLSMKIEDISSEALKGPYITSFSLPLTFRPAQADSMIYHRSFDPLLGFVQEQSMYAPPPYVY